ncbi:MAG: UPF0158 family protein [Eubacteriaceae bacterium]
MRKQLKVEEVSYYVQKCITDESDIDIITYWYDYKNNYFVYYEELVKKYGLYNIEIFIKQEYLPLDQINIIQLKRDFLEEIDPIDSRNELKKYINDTKKEFDIAFNMMLDEYLDLGDLWHHFFMESIIKKAINWLDKNNLQYKISKRYKAFLK